MQRDFSSFGTVPVGHMPHMSREYLLWACPGGQSSQYDTRSTGFTLFLRARVPGSHGTAHVSK